MSLCCYVIIMLLCHHYVMYCDVCTRRPRCGKNTTRLSFVLLLVLLSFPPLFESFFYTRFSHSILCPEPVLVNDLLHQMYIMTTTMMISMTEMGMLLCILSCHYIIIMLLCYVYYCFIVLCTGNWSHEVLGTVVPSAVVRKNNILFGAILFCI